MNKEPSNGEDQPKLPYRLYRDPNLVMAFDYDSRLLRFAQDAERAEQFHDHFPDDPLHAQGAEAAAASLASYVEKQGYAVAGAPPEDVLPDDNL
jgi:hypothetical protein